MNMFVFRFRSPYGSPEFTRDISHGCIWIMYIAGCIVSMLSNIAFPPYDERYFGGAPVFRFMRNWLRRGTITNDDLVTLVLWILTAVVLSIILAFYFMKKGVDKLEASST